MEPMDTIFSSKYILPFSVVAVALVVVLGAAFLLNQNVEPQQTPTPTATVEVSEFEVRRLFEAGGQYGVADLKISPDGTMLVVTLESGGGYGPSSYIYSFPSPDQRIFPLNTSFHSMSWNPNSKILAYASSDGGEIIEGEIEDGEPALKSGIWIMNADGSGTKRLTSPDTIANFPSWNPDGGKIIFVMEDSSNDFFQIWTMNKDGSNQRQLTNDLSNKATLRFSPNGELILYRVIDREESHPSSEGYNFWVMNKDGSNKKEIVWAGKGITVGKLDSIRNILWSPKGDKILIDDGRTWTINPDGSGLELLTDSRYVASDSVWSPDGIKTAYLGGGLWVMNSDGSNKMQLVEPLERGPTGPLAWSPDGKRILFINNFTEVWSIDLAQ